jgi:drug/metabolite transporter (DMT)-like permease
MFGHEAQAGASLLGTSIALAVPLAAAANWTLLQHLGSASRASECAVASDLQDMLPAVLVGAILSALATLPFSFPFQATGHDLVLLAFLGTVQLAIPCLLAVRLTRELPAPEIALLSLLEVLFGVLWAWLGAGETPGFNALIGGALVLGALVGNEVLALRERRAS